MNVAANIGEYRGIWERRCTTDKEADGTSRKYVAIFSDYYTKSSERKAKQFLL